MKLLYQIHNLLHTQVCGLQYKDVKSTFMSLKHETTSCEDSDTQGIARDYWTFYRTEAEAGAKMKKPWTMESDTPGPNHSPAAYRLCKQAYLSVKQECNQWQGISYQPKALWI